MAPNGTSLHKQYPWVKKIVDKKLADRKARRLARQRGAGYVYAPKYTDRLLTVRRTREIKNANFGFTIDTAPLTAKKSTGRRSKTPQALPARLSSSRTPKATQASSSKTPARDAATGRQSSSAPKSGMGKSAKGKAQAQGYDTPAVTGKRKRGTEQEEDELEADDEEHRNTAKKTFTTPATRPSTLTREASNGSASRIEEGNDELEVADADHTIVSTSANAHASSASLPFAAESANRVASDLTATPAPNASQPGQIMTPFIDPMLLATRQSTAKGKSKLRRSTSGNTAEAENIQSTYAPGDIVSFRPRTPVAPVARMLPVSAGPSTLHVPGPMATDISPLFQPGEEADAEGSPARVFSDSSSDSGEEDELTPAPSTSLIRKTKTSQTRKPKSTPKKSTKLKIGSRPKAQPATKPKKKKMNAKTKAYIASVRRSTSPSSFLRRNSPITVPITVYYPTNISSLALYSTQNPDADPLGSEPIPSLNPVDVLSQICGEITKSFVESYDKDGEANMWASDGVRKRQKRAVAKFGALLQDALFALASNVQSGLAVRKRLVAEVKRRRAVKDELVQLRIRREDGLREMDGVRKEYARRKEEFEAKTRVSDLIFQIRGFVAERKERWEERVGKGEVDPNAEANVRREVPPMHRPLEDLVDDVEEAGIVGEGEGLLARVKRLNEMMEAMAEEIEGES